MAENFGAVAVGQTTARAWADRNNSAVALSNDDQAAAPHLDDEDEFEESKTLLRILEDNAFAIEAGLYLVFLILFTVYAVGVQGNNNDMYAMGEQIRRIYGPFASVADTTTWFTFMRGAFINATYPVRYYNDDPIADDDMGHVEGQYKLLGVINVRQVRVRKDACSVQSRMKVLVPACEALFSRPKENLAEYGPVVPGTGAKEFQYTDQSEYGCSGSSCDFVGPSSQLVYPGSGYVVSLPTVGEAKTRASALTMINQLSDSLYIDRYTSAVFVESVLYDATRHAVALVRLVLELPPSGLVHSTIQVVAMPLSTLYPAQEGGESFLVLEVFVLIGVICFSIHQLKHWNAVGTRAYWSSGWAWIDWTNYIIFFACFSLRYGSLQQASVLKFPPDYTEYVSYWGPAGTISRWKQVLGVNAIITWLKSIKYLYKMSFLQDIIQLVYSVVEDTLWLIVLGMSITFGFAIAFLLCYGDVLASYSTLGTSMVSLYKLMIGSASDTVSMDTSQALGPFFMVSFTALMSLLLLNIFVAVLLKNFLQVEPSPSVVTVVSRQLHHPRVKKRLARVVEFVEKMSCGLLSSSAPDATEDIVADGTAAGGNAHASAVGEREGVGDAGMETAALKRIEAKLAHDMDLNLQCLLQLSKEVRSLSHRVKHLTETAETPSVFS